MSSLHSPIAWKVVPTNAVPVIALLDVHWHLSSWFKLIAFTVLLVKFLVIFSFHDHTWSNFQVAQTPPYLQLLKQVTKGVNVINDTD